MGVVPLLLRILYPTTVTYQREGQTHLETLNGFVLQNTEAFLNHTLFGPRTIRLGSNMTDPEGKTWTQDRSAWCLPVGKGWVFYGQPGHAVSDFENPSDARIVVNAVI